MSIPECNLCIFKHRAFLSPSTRCRRDNGVHDQADQREFRRSRSKRVLGDRGSCRRWLFGRHVVRIHWVACSKHGTHPAKPRSALETRRVMDSFQCTDTVAILCRCTFRLLFSAVGVSLAECLLGRLQQRPSLAWLCDSPLCWTTTYSHHESILAHYTQS